MIKCNYVSIFIMLKVLAIDFEQVFVITKNIVEFDQLETFRFNYKIDPVF